jgi:hypothetical protein
MRSLFVFLEIWFLIAGSTTILVGLAWPRWYRDLPRLKEPKWRSVTLLAGFVAGSVDVLLVHGWLWYFGSFSGKSVYPIIFGTGLCVLALLTAIVGKGGARLTLAAAGVLGVFGWACAFLFTILD